MTTKKRKRKLEELRQALLLRRRQLTRAVRGEVDQLHSDSGEVRDEEGDSRDEMTSFALIEIGSNSLEQIDWALERFDQGVYGLCEECEEPIDIDRLEGLPFATMCMDCKRAQERAGGR